MKKRLFSIICVTAMLLSMFPYSYAEEENELDLNAPAQTEPYDEEAPLLPGSDEVLPSEDNTEVVLPDSIEEPVVDEIEAPTMVQVGLYYGSTAVNSTNLQNAVGTGYRVGYMDENRAFQELGYIDEIYVSVAKAANVWYGTKNDYTCYFDSITSDIAVGCYHILIASDFTSYDEIVTAIQGMDGYFPAWINGSWQLWYGSYADSKAAQSDADTLGGTVVTAGAYGVSVLRRGTSDILFLFDGDSTYSLAVAPGVDDTEKAVTWLKGKKYYGIFQYARSGSSGDLTVSNFLSIDDYASCVASREMSSSWPLEALKAQTVCVRTYYNQSVSSGRHRSQGFDICNTTHCQVYFGMAQTNERTEQAAEETSGLGIWYHGEPAEIFYYSSNGGATEACKNVWVSDRPYLVGIIDPYEETIADMIPKYYWTVTYTADELTEYLHQKGYAVGANVINLQVSETTPTGNVKRITFTFDNGKTQSFSKDNARIFLGLRSLRYTISSSYQTIADGYVADDGISVSTDEMYVINADGTVAKIEGNAYVVTTNGIGALSTFSGNNTEQAENEDVVFAISGSGYGHNVGMSQWGAYAMAQQGFTFEDILKFYFTGVEIYE